MFNNSGLKYGKTNCEGQKNGCNYYSSNNNELLMHQLSCPIVVIYKKYKNKMKHLKEKNSELVHLLSTIKPPIKPPMTTTSTSPSPTTKLCQNKEMVKKNFFYFLFYKSKNNFNKL